MKLLKIISRLLQIAVLIIFGYWIYLKYFGSPLDFAILSIILLPFIIGGLVIGFLTSLFLLFSTPKSNKALKAYNIIMLLLYIAAAIYMLVIIV